MLEQRPFITAGDRFFLPKAVELAARRRAKTESTFLHPPPAINLSIRRQLTVILRDDSMSVAAIGPYHPLGLLSKVAVSGRVPSTNVTRLPMGHFERTAVGSSGLG